LATLVARYTKVEADYAAQNKGEPQAPALRVVTAD
jgi:hypothetical protein